MPPHSSLLEPVPADELLQRLEREQRIPGAAEQDRARLHDLLVAVPASVASTLEVLPRLVRETDAIEQLCSVEQERVADVPLKPLRPDRFPLGLA